MKRTGILLLLIIILSLSPLGALNVKLGSPFPEGTAWDTSLKRMAAEWADITGGRVRIRIYPGGVAGNDADMIRKIRFGQLDAAVLTSFGLKTIVPNSFVMSLPGMFQSEAELDFIMEQYTSNFDEAFIREGFRVLAWSKSGWAYFFSKQPASTPELMRRETLAVSATDEEVAANFKALRFNVVPVSLNELMVSLQSGMVSAFYAPPMASAAYQWFSQAPFMIDVPIAPVLGGLVISERTWNRIPVEYHAELKKAIEDVAGSFYAESERINTEAMKVMSNHGLEVARLSESQKKDWYDILIDGHKLVVGEGNWIDEEVYADFISRIEYLR
ncbi:MAG: TRAP transporter substrate-binding protein DctP [Spirochaetaceae bacterium]|nr:TRAP transporter substrate-binding protein DctP [Spirochaetaceae bacterium]MDT8297881.1 TRAP transporter substrate-binding protein DctP [Spirochaetaceae bacterium]